MIPPLYVVDTSYLWELLKGGDDKSTAASDTVRELFDRAAKQRSLLYVPLPCIFELANKIAKIKHLKRRQELADWLCDSVLKCLKVRAPWIITPTGDPTIILPQLIETFRTQKTARIFGMVDLFILNEAERIKSAYSDRKATVHIWTNDRALKDREPDKESNRFLW